MRLFLSETFFDAVFKLPKKTQDKVVAFQKKFRENPASPWNASGTNCSVQ